VALYSPEQFADRADGDALGAESRLQTYMIAFVNGHSHDASSAPAIPAPGSGVSLLGRNLYLVFVASWFLHLGARVPALGAIRIDLILVVVLTILAFAGKSKERTATTEIDKVLRVLFVYALLVTPFVEWPGSVIRTGIPEFIKAVVFYYFTIAFIKSESDLKALVFVFLACQLFRVLEPLYLHVTLGYWGSVASMSNWEFLNRLSGSPYDVVNPNGLAAIICTVLLFLYYLAGLSWINTLAFLALAPACLYALALTGSRSGFVTLIVILAVIVLKSRHRFLVGAAGVLVIVAGFQFLSADQQDRYLSVFGAGEKNLETADQRFDSMEADFLVAMRRPVLGHGLGTSQEANANFGGRNQPSHNLYLEVVQELGLIGLAIFLLFLKSILTASVQLRRAYADAYAAKFPLRLVDALQVWLWMNLIFSLASYGLSVYEWYLMGGLLLVMRRFAVTPRGNVAQGATM
jgi:O-antigen ligase